MYPHVYGASNSLWHFAKCSIILFALPNARFTILPIFYTVSILIQIKCNQYLKVCLEVLFLSLSRMSIGLVIMIIFISYLEEKQMVT